MNCKAKRAKKKKLLRRDGWRCWLCGEKLESFHRATLDHIIPTSKGGSNDIENLRLAHADCNSRRGCADGIAYERLAA